MLAFKVLGATSERHVVYVRSGRADVSVLGSPTVTVENTVSVVADTELPSIYPFPVKVTQLGDSVPVSLDSSVSIDSTLPVTPTWVNEDERSAWRVMVSLACMCFGFAIGGVIRGRVV